MAKQLWLLRHAEAEPRGALPDEQRALTERGEGQARAAGVALAALEVRLDAVLTSPRVRALETARLACEMWEDGPSPEVYEPLSAGFEGRQALDLLAAWDADAHLMIVGHEPDFSRLIAELTGASVKLKKGGVAMVDVAYAAGGELVVLARPRELALMARVAASEV
jgi:phosphohistidine phosphatase